MYSVFNEGDLFLHRKETHYGDGRYIKGHLHRLVLSHLFVWLCQEILLMYLLQNTFIYFRDILWSFKETFIGCLTGISNGIGLSVPVRILILVIFLGLVPTPPRIHDTSHPFVRLLPVHPYNEGELI